MRTRTLALASCLLVAFSLTLGGCTQAQTSVQPAAGEEVQQVQEQQPAPQQQPTQQQEAAQQPEAEPVQEKQQPASPEVTYSCQTQELYAQRGENQIYGVVYIPQGAGNKMPAVIFSREVFTFLPISGGIALARPMHIFCSFWSFVLMALHLGLHWNMVLGMVRRATGPVSSPVLRWTLRIGGAAVAVYGLYALVKNQIPSYLLLQSSFVFFDFERPLPLFFTEYLAIMGLFVFLAHYGAWGVQRLTKKG